MALTETTAIDKIEILSSGHVQVRRATTIFNDGVEVSRTYQRVTYEPDADVSHEDAQVQAIAQAAWTGVAPATPLPRLPARVVSRLDFARLFTAEERIAARAAATDNAALADFAQLVELADTVNLDHPDVAAGLAAMTVAALLTEPRRARILAGELPEIP